MIKRIVEISSAGYLFTRNCRLFFKKERGELQNLPLEDIGILVLDNYALTYSHALFNQCLEKNICILLCDKKHLPQAILSPFAQHSLHQKVLAQQIQVKKPLKKNLWQKIIQAKILEQAESLTRCKKKDFGLKKMACRVLSGDSKNLEGQAAKIYWKKLFGNHFCRDPEQEGINRLLNYGYAIMRAMVARALSSTGLHPALGIHHSNQYNSFCLADDLMEPLRALVDEQIFQISIRNTSLELTPNIKKKILELLTRYCLLKGKECLLLTGVQLYAASFKKALLGESQHFSIPQFLF